jgi:hypothetical protein
MFERYETHAKRSIFYAKRNAREYGSGYVEPEHLLMGILREVPRILSEFVAESPEVLFDEAEKIALDRKVRQVRAATPEISGDVPLGPETIRVLEKAAEEAERAAQDKINPMHLIVAMLNEEGTGASELLKRFEVTLPKLRARFGYWELAMETASSPPPQISISNYGVHVGPEVLFVLPDGRSIGSTTTLDYVPRLKERLRLSLERGYTSEFTVVDVRYDYKPVDMNDASCVQRLKTIVIYLKPRHGHDEEEYSSLT